VESTALLDAVQRGELDRLIIPPKPLDVLAQQIVAEVAAREYHEDELFDLMRRAWPYHDLTRAEFDAVLHMLSEGYATRRGRRSAYLHRDAVNRRVRGRKGARLTALTNGGAIPDNADYRVVLTPTDTFIGTLNEDFAIESQAGDIFQLGNASYRILKVESGVVRVEDARGAPPSIPFWIGEAPARTDELSSAVARLRGAVSERLTEINADALAATTEWLMRDLHLGHSAAQQLTEYLAAAKGMLGVLPTQDTLVLERFFDETGGQQLIVHSPFGSRVNRAWGLALRKRFCRKFNFELQAAVTEDAIILSLGETHSFPLEEVAKYLNSRSVRAVLTQALLTAPLFNVRWRWVANISLAVKRFRGGRKNPPQFQRIEAEDLVAVVFPDQIACAENIVGDREVPDHPLVNQTMADCLTEAMDIEQLELILEALEHGTKQIVARDLPHPSPLAQEILNERPYGFLDDAPLEERRTQAVASRRWLDPTEAAEFGQLDLDAINRVREEAWPTIDSADELHDALMLLGAMPPLAAAQNLFDALARERRATTLNTLWIAAERLPMLRAIYPQGVMEPIVEAPAEFAARPWTRDEALIELARGQLQGLGPITAALLGKRLGLDEAAMTPALLALEGEGFAMRGQFTPGGLETEWCERRLLARIHRYTLSRLRAEIEPVSAAICMRFLLRWQGLDSETLPEGPQALAAIVEQLEGFEAAAASWETDILPVRTAHYDPEWLDSLCLSGRVLWTRLTPPKPAAGKDRVSGPVRSTPIALLTRRQQFMWQRLTSSANGDGRRLSPRAQSVADHLATHGASFFEDIIAGTGLLKAQVEESLAELVAAGVIHSDSFAGLRALLMPAEKQRRLRRRRALPFGIETAGRWALVARRDSSNTTDPESVEVIARLLLRRYGVVFKRLLERESAFLPPWYELLRVYRRLEARGEIRGGRFVAGFTGEQYALPEALASLRALRKQADEGRLIAVSAADPLNLVGILTPGARVPAIAGNRVLYRDGVPIAVQTGGEATFLEDLAPGDEWTARNALLRSPLASGTRAFLH
jgi:ATP-dependent Lhr-like helicase